MIDGDDVIRAIAKVKASQELAEAREARSLAGEPLTVEDLAEIVRKIHGRTGFVVDR